MTEQPDSDELLHKLNRETAKIAWSELQRFYAQGAVLEVSSALDLIAVAAAMAADDAGQIREFLNNGQLARVDEQTASDWFESQRELWAVVVAPWVLVQTERELN